MSLYFWLRRPGSHVRLAQNTPHAMVVLELDFDDYIDWYVENWHSFKDWIFVDGKIPDNLEIIRMEDLTYTAHINKSNHKPFMEYYNEETKRKLYEFNKWCFDRFYNEEK